MTLTIVVFGASGECLRASGGHGAGPPRAHEFSLSAR